MGRGLGVVAPWPGTREPSARMATSLRPALHRAALASCVRVREKGQRAPSAEGCPLRGTIRIVVTGPRRPGTVAQPHRLCSANPPPPQQNKVFSFYLVFYGLILPHLNLESAWGVFNGGVRMGKRCILFSAASCLWGCHRWHRGTGKSVAPAWRSPLPVTQREAEV